MTVHYACPLTQCGQPVQPDDKLSGDRRKATCRGCKDWLFAWDNAFPSPREQFNDNGKLVTIGGRR